MPDETSQPEKAAPAPAEDSQQTGGSVDEIIARAMQNAVGDEGAESLPEDADQGTSAPPSPGDPSETPDSEAAPPAGESETPEEGKSTGSGESPFIELKGQKFTQDELQDIIEAHVNRQTFQEAAKAQSDKIRQQVEQLEQAKKQVQEEQARIAQEREQNEAYSEYISWLNEGNSGDIREFMQERAPRRKAQPQQRPATPEDLDARIARVLEQRESQGRQQSIEKQFDGWVDELVTSEPVLKGREHAYGASITQRFVEECQRQRVLPTQFTETQIKGFLRQYLKEAVQVERKLSETTLADRLDRAAKTKEKLPAAPRTQGTPLPQQPNGFKLDLKKLAQEAPDTDTYFQALEKSLKEQSDELSSMANRLG